MRSSWKMRSWWVLALATHGKAGLDALWSGSVGAKVVTRSANSLLLVRPAR